MGTPEPKPGRLSAESEFATTAAAALAPACALDLDTSEAASPAAADPEHAPTLGHIGRYALKGQLGAGGLGIVYEAWDPLLSRAVALKTLQFNVDGSTRESLDRMFLNEARAVARLNHPHIVTVFDAGLSSQGVYIAMARLRGRDMRQALTAGWQPSPGAAALLVRRVADALDYAHARGVVHCDIKPGNIFLGRDERPTVLDFGIARLRHGAASPVPDGVITGSPLYLAPEQLQGGVVDARSDVYALGVVLYELLAGRRPFGGDSIEQIHTAVLHHHPAPPHRLRPSVPAGLSALTMRAMARDPAQRQANASELAQQLRRWQARSADEDGAGPWPRRAIWGGGGALALGVSAWLLSGVLLEQATAPSAPVAMAVEAPAAEAIPAPPAAEAAPPVLAARGEPAPPRAEPRPATAAKPTQRPARTQATAAPALAPTPAPAAATANGRLNLAVSPWGLIELNGSSVGVTPPLTRLDLPVGPHTVTVRNGDFPAYSTEVQVSADQPVTVKHRFGP